MENDEEKDWKVYYHKNKINNKMYIGITSQSLKQRFQNGLGYRGCSKFYNAIEKYGWDNFEHGLLEDGLTQEEACQKEQYYIKKYDTLKNGYNLTSGGDSGKKLSEETKEKLRQLNTKERNPNWGRIFGEETRKKMSEAHKGEKAYWYGKHLTEETKKKLSESHKGKKQSPETIEKRRQALLGKGAKKVICLNTGEIFNSVTEAALWAGLKSHCPLSKHLAGKTKSSGVHPITKEKLIWAFYTEEGE